MSPESNSPEIHEQGSLFETHIIQSGIADPEIANKPSVVFEAVPEGKYTNNETALEPEQSEDDVTLSGLKEVVAKQNRRKAQLGKHSPLERSGSYQNGLKVGDYLPGFGPVKWSNLDDAQRHAARLDRDRR